MTQGVAIDIGSGFDGERLGLEFPVYAAALHLVLTPQTLQFGITARVADQGCRGLRRGTGGARRVRGDEIPSEPDGSGCSSDFFTATAAAERRLTTG